MKQVKEVHGYVEFQELSRKWVWVLITAGQGRGHWSVHVLLCGFCSSIHCSRCGNTGCTTTHCRKKVDLWSPHPQWGMLYIITVITKGSSQLRLWAGAKELSWVLKRKFTHCWYGRWCWYCHCLPYQEQVFQVLPALLWTVYYVHAGLCLLSQHYESYTHTCLSQLPMYLENYTST